MFITRTIVGLLAAGLLLGIVLLHGVYIQAAVVIVALIMEYEMIRTMKASGKIKPIAPVLYAVTLALPVLTYFFSDIGAVYALVGGLLALFICGITCKRYNMESVCYSVFAMFYPQFLMLFLYKMVLVLDVAKSQLMIFTAFAAAVCEDTLAYYIGRLFGRHKLCPEISPKKTIEGAAGGLAGGIIGTVVLALIWGHQGIGIGWYVLLGAVLGTLCQFGDLAASLIKRQFGAKDFGNLLPGHGGLMDRLDSTIFILPVVWLFFHLFGM